MIYRFFLVFVVIFLVQSCSPENKKDYFQEFEKIYTNQFGYGVGYGGIYWVDN